MSSNSSLRIVVVGGVAGGASAATRARRMNADAQITIFEKGPVVSFANCGLPYHVGGEIAQRAKLIVATPELFQKRFRIETKTLHEIVSIDRDRKIVHGINLQTQMPFEVPYDRLILSTGSEPRVPEFFNAKTENVFHLWTLSDMDRVMKDIDTHGIQNAIVVGGGFVGLEVVEQLVRRKIAVSLIERNPQVLMRLDVAMARMVERHMREHDVQLYLGQSIDELIVENDRAVGAILRDGTQLESDLIVVGAGVSPRIQLARDAGLAIGQRGGVSVNESMQTSDPDIYAVGDIVEYTEGITQERSLNPLAGPANRSGRIAGTHAAVGHSQPMGPVFGTSIVRVFDFTAASTGLNERMLNAKSIPYRSAIIQAPHHASYFPGATSMHLKLIYSPIDGKILGAQAVGIDGVDKRIDVIATAMLFQATVYQLAQVDLAYAPPFGSAKDPVHMAAFAACNDLESTPNLLPPDADLEGLQVVDVRTSTERDQIPLDHSHHIPVDEIMNRWKELDPDRDTVVVCHSGKRAHVAACWLNGQGFKSVANLSGGMSVRSLVNEANASVSQQ